MTHISSEKIKRGIKHWWLFLVTGLLLLIIGIFAVSNPLGSYLALSIFFASSILLGGVIRTVFAISNKSALPSWGWMLAIGIIEALLGLALFIYPGLSAVVLLFIIGFYIIVSGTSLIRQSMELKKFKTKGWGWILTGGILTVLFGFLVILNPAVGIVTVVAYIGFGMFALALFNIILAFILRHWKKEIEDYHIDKELVSMKKV